MTLQQCKYVLKIAEVGSFNEAARQLFIAQSGLSNSIKLLEEEIGIKIFERSKNGATLTAEGAEFVGYAEGLLAQAEFITGRYATESDTERLYISTQHYDFIADVFCLFARESKSERYDMSLQEKRTHEVIHDVEVGKCDVGIIAIKNSDSDVMMRYLQSKDISFFEFLVTPPHLFVKSTHPLASKSRISYGELGEYPYVSYDQGKYNNSSLFTEEISGNIPTSGHIVISDRATLMNVLLNTDCYTVGTGIMPSELNDGKIVSIPIVTDETYTVGYIVKKTKLLPKMAEKFISTLNEYAKELRKRST